MALKSGHYAAMKSKGYAVAQPAARTPIDAGHCQRTKAIVAVQGIACGQCQQCQYPEKQLGQRTAKEMMSVAA